MPKINVDGNPVKHFIDLTKLPIKTTRGGYPFFDFNAMSELVKVLDESLDELFSNAPDAPKEVTLKTPIGKRLLTVKIKRTKDQKPGRTVS